MENLFREEVVENKKHRLSGVISLVQPPAFWHLTLLILIIVIVSIVFLSLGSYSRKEKVSGVLLPETGVAKLMAPEAGVISELFVTEGQVVKVGEPILRVISEKYGVEGFELNQSLIDQYNVQRYNLEQQLVQQRTLHQLQRAELKSNHKNRQNRLAQIDIQDTLIQQRITINQQILKQTAKLSGSGYVSDLELKKQQDTLLSLKQQSSLIESEQLALNNQIEQIDNQLAKLPLEQNKVTQQLKKQIEEIKIQSNKVKQQRLSELKAPVDGIVTGLLVKQGKALSNNQKILTILPSNTILRAVIYLPTAAFGFIEVGQKTRIRYHAFPYEKFGIYEGKITEVSANVILPNETTVPGIITEPSYRAIIELETDKINAYGKTISLSIGMTLEADIIIEERTLIHWLFDPIYSIQGRL